MRKTNKQQKKKDNIQETDNIQRFLQALDKL